MKVARSDPDANRAIAEVCHGEEKRRGRISDRAADTCSGVERWALDSMSLSS